MADSYIPTSTGEPLGSVPAFCRLHRDNTAPLTGGREDLNGQDSRSIFGVVKGQRGAGNVLAIPRNYLTRSGPRAKEPAAATATAWHH